jgi:hypothetical protein
MKGVPGLMMALGLGIVGAFCNWFYLAQKAREVEMVDFIGRAAAGPTETIGPFRILALGNRLGTPEVLRASGQAAAQENVMAVAVKLIGRDLDEPGQKLSELLRITNFQQVQVLLHKGPITGKGKS